MAVILLIFFGHAELPQDQSGIARVGAQRPIQLSKHYVAVVRDPLLGMRRRFAVGSWSCWRLFWAGA
jgi:hypothetical protein